MARFHFVIVFFFVFCGAAVAEGWLSKLGKKCELDSPEKPYSVQQVPAPLLAGKTAYRFELRKGEGWHHRGRFTFRSEISTGVYPPQGAVRSYSFSLWIPKDFPVEDNRLVLAQWWAKTKRELGEVSRSPALAFRFRNGRFYITVRHSPERVLKDANQAKEEILFETTHLPLGAWNRFVVEAKWSFESDGFVNIDWNGQSISRYRGPVGYNDDHGPEFIFGIYRDDSPSTYTVFFRDVQFRDE